LQAETKDPAIIKSAQIYVYQDLTLRIQYVGGVFTAAFFGVVAIFVVIRDFLGWYDFGE
jgi:hypothetical protein